MLLLTAGRPYRTLLRVTGKNCYHRGIPEKKPRSFWLRYLIMLQRKPGATAVLHNTTWYCLSLPQGGQAREVVRAPTAIRQRLTNALAYAGQTESTVLLEKPETLDAEPLQEEEAEAKAEAEKDRPELTMFTNGSRLGNGAARCVVVWKDGRSWVGIKAHLGYNQEAYDAEYAALARALESASRSWITPERFTIFTDARAAIRRMVSKEPGPGQQYALQVRKHIATLRRARPGVIIEIRCCPAHKGISGNDKADEWARIAAEEPNTRGVEATLTGSRRGPCSSRGLLLTSSGRSPRRSTECQNTRSQTARWLVALRGSPRGSTNSRRDAACPGSISIGRRTGTPRSAGWCRYQNQTREHLFKECPEQKAQQKILWAEVWKETGRWKSRWKIRDLLADARCSQAALDFLNATDVGRNVLAEESEGSEASEWELREY